MSALALPALIEMCAPPSAAVPPCGPAEETARAGSVSSIFLELLKPLVIDCGESAAPGSAPESTAETPAGKDRDEERQSFPAMTIPQVASDGSISGPLCTPAEDAAGAGKLLALLMPKPLAIDQDESAAPASTPETAPPKAEDSDEKRLVPFVMDLPQPGSPGGTPRAMSLGTSPEREGTAFGGERADAPSYTRVTIAEAPCQTTETAPAQAANTRPLDSDSAVQPEWAAPVASAPSRAEPQPEMAPRSPEQLETKTEPPPQYAETKPPEAARSLKDTRGTSDIDLVLAGRLRIPPQGEVDVAARDCGEAGSELAPERSSAITAEPPNPPAMPIHVERERVPGSRPMSEIVFPREAAAEREIETTPHETRMMRPEAQANKWELRRDPAAHPARTESGAHETEARQKKALPTAIVPEPPGEDGTAPKRELAFAGRLVGMEGGPATAPYRPSPETRVASVFPNVAPPAERPREDNTAPKRELAFAGRLTRIENGPAAEVDPRSPETPAASVLPNVAAAPAERPAGGNVEAAGASDSPPAGRLMAESPNAAALPGTLAAQGPVRDSHQGEIAARHAPERATFAHTEVAMPGTNRPPAREIALSIDGGDSRVELRVRERGGEIRVSVRTPDAALAGDLRDRLPWLSDRLEQAGLKAEAWHTGLESGPSREGAAGEFRNEHGRNGQDARDRRGQREMDQNRDPEAREDRRNKEKEFTWWMQSLG